MEINIENFLKETEVFLEQEKEKANSRNGKGNNNPQYQIIYPGALGGKLKIKLLWNLKSNTVIKQIERHPGFGDNGKTQIPCLKKYGVACPICDLINQIENEQGQNSKVKDKYGVKPRSIAYAQLIDYNEAYTDMPEKGSVILFMFPYTIYAQIMTKMNEAGANSKVLCATNEGRTLDIDTALTRSASMYSVSISPFGTVKSFPTDKEYEDLLMSLPDLSDAVTPKELSENLMNRVNAAVDTMKAEYGMVPSDMPVAETKIVNEQKTPQQVIAEQANQQAAAQVVQTTVTQPVPDLSQGVTTVTMDQKLQEQANAGRPECFGNHSMTEKKCLVCPHAIDCSDIS